MKRLMEMIERAYALAVQVQDDNRDEQVLQILAEEVSGECAELLAHLNRDEGAFDNDECKDPELVELSKKLLTGE